MGGCFLALRGMVWTPMYVGYFALFEYSNMHVQIDYIENGGNRGPPRIIDPEGKQKARQVDRISRRMFPLTFTLFNIVYWLMYTLPLDEMN